MLRRNALAPLALILAFLAAAAVPAFAQRGDDTNRRSKNGRLAATVDGVEVVVEYGRPQVRGREIWGALVPYGKVWRTGADEPTTISVGAPVEIEGESLPAGTYALFTIPGEERWTVIVNRNAKQWGAMSYDQAEDLLRVEVTPRPGEPVEELTFAAAEDGIVLQWAGLEVPIRIAVLGAPLVTEDAAESVTLSGDLVCAKCTLKLEGFEKCQDVLVVAGEDGGQELYFVAANEVAKDEGHTCKGSKAVTMEGTLAEADGKTWITPSKIEPADA
jgi:hypothetical protein